MLNATIDKFENVSDARVSEELSSDCDSILKGELAEWALFSTHALQTFRKSYISIIMIFQKIQGQYAPLLKMLT